MAEMSKIMYCPCVHKYQDEKYGKNQRVFVYAIKAENYRCTVCGTLKKQSVTVNKEEKEKKKSGKSS